LTYQRHSFPIRAAENNFLMTCMRPLCLWFFLIIRPLRQGGVCPHCVLCMHPAHLSLHPCTPLNATCTHIYANGFPPRRNSWNKNNNGANEQYTARETQGAMRVVILSYFHVVCIYRMFRFSAMPLRSCGISAESSFHLCLLPVQLLALSCDVYHEHLKLSCA
jgi:hypothetical protein